MTITEAIKDTGIPRSRVLTAIKRGLIPAEKISGGGARGIAWHFEAEAFKRARERHGQWIRHDRTITIRLYRDLLLESSRHTFTTTAAADEFEVLAKKAGYHKQSPERKP